MLRRRHEERKEVLAKEQEDLKNKEEQLDIMIRNKEELLVMEQEDDVNKVKEEQRDREQEDAESKVQEDTMIGTMKDKDMEERIQQSQMREGMMEMTDSSDHRRHHREARRQLQSCQCYCRRTQSQHLEPRHL